VRLLDLVATKNTPFDVVGKLLLNLVPHYLSLALSAAFFIAVLMAVIRLREDSELDALYAGGVSLYRIARPIFGLACLFCLLGALVIGVLQPHARYGYRNLMHFAGYGSWYNVLESGAFLTGIDDMTMTVGDISEDGRELQDVFFHERDKSGVMTTTTAERGRFDVSENETLVLTLTNATQVVDGVPDEEPLVVKVKSFSREIETLFAPPPFRPRGRDERELTLTELWQWEGKPPKRSSVDEMAAELHARIVRIVSVLFLPFLAVALGAMSPKRRQGLNLALGLFLLIVYNEILQFGEDMAEEGTISPWLGQQLPMLLFLIFSLWMLVHAARRASASGLDLMAALGHWLSDAFRLLRPARDG
ncbi:MAG: LptF/LptG family permease, partial [Alphaproteobacteria bacterium]|nr:LptF/LptG family permease [Alphaproteobacteria bacterium]